MKLRIGDQIIEPPKPESLTSTPGLGPGCYLVLRSSGGADVYLDGLPVGEMTPEQLAEALETAEPI